MPPSNKVKEKNKQRSKFERAITRGIKKVEKRPTGIKMEGRAKGEREVGKYVPQEIIGNRQKTKPSD